MSGEQPNFISLRDLIDSWQSGSFLSVDKIY